MDMTEADKAERLERQKKELELRAKKRNSRLFLFFGSISMALPQFFPSGQLTFSIMPFQTRSAPVITSPSREVYVPSRTVCAIFRRSAFSRRDCPDAIPPLLASSWLSLYSQGFRFFSFAIAAITAFPMRLKPAFI